MNSTTNQTSPVFYMSKEKWLNFFGATFLKDSLKVYLFTPFAFSGFLLNLVSFIVFNLKGFRNQPLYIYLKAFILNSMLIEALQATVFLVSSYKFFDFSNTHPALFYYSYLYKPILSTGYFFGTALDILIILERISQLNKKFKIFKKASPLLACLVSLMFCLAINIPFFMVNDFAYVDLNTSPNETFRLFYYTYSSFSASFLGKIITFVVYGIRDVFTLLSQIVLGVILIVLVKSYVNKRKILFNIVHS